MPVALRIIREWRGLLGLAFGFLCAVSLQAAIADDSPWTVERFEAPARATCDRITPEHVEDALFSSWTTSSEVFHCHAADMLTPEATVLIEERAAKDQRAANSSGTRAMKLGNVEHAIHHFLQAIALAPQGPAGYSNLATAYLKSNQPTQARWMLEQAAATPGAPCAGLKGEPELARLTADPQWYAHCKAITASASCSRGVLVSCGALLWSGALAALRTPAVKP